MSPARRCLKASVIQTPHTSTTDKPLKKDSLFVYTADRLREQRAARR